MILIIFIIVIYLGIILAITLMGNDKSKCCNADIEAYSWKNFYCSKCGKPA